MDGWRFAWCVWWISTLSLTVPYAAHAQDTAASSSAPDDDAARRMFRIGQAHYDNGQFAQAASEFEEAYRLSQRPELLYNLYVAYRDAGDAAHAAQALRGYLDQVPDAENAAALRARLEVMDQALADAQSAEPTDDTPPEDTQETTPPPPSSGPSVPTSPIAWTITGVGAAALVASIVTGVLALDAHDSLASACGPTHDACPATFESDRDRGRALSQATDGLWIGGGLALVTGVVLLFVLDQPVSDAPPVTAACDANGCALTLSGRF